MGNAAEIGNALPCDRGVACSDRGLFAHDAASGITAQRRLWPGASLTLSAELSPGYLSWPVASI
jgi:hypothetical protein